MHLALLTFHHRIWLLPGNIHKVIAKLHRMAFAQIILKRQPVCPVDSPTTFVGAPQAEKSVLKK